MFPAIALKEAPTRRPRRRGHALLGRATDGYRKGCAILEQPVHALGPEFFARPGRPADEIMFREYLCPATGKRLDAEIVRRGDPIETDIRISLSSGQC